MLSNEGPRGAERAVAIAPRTTLGVGGAADWWLRAELPQDLSRAHAWCVEHDEPMTVFGGGSNVVVADEGIAGLVVQPGLTGVTFTRVDDDTLMFAGAAESWDDVVAASVARGLSGIESLSGIPGSVGGTPIQNVGAYGQEVADTIDSLMAFDRIDGRLLTMVAADCAFGYRTSRFKTIDVDRFVVCAVTFRLRATPPAPTYPELVQELQRRIAGTPTVSDVRESVLAIRRRKGMVLDPTDPDTRSVGSFFTNPIVTADVVDHIATRSGTPPPAFDIGAGRYKVPAAWLIERSGFPRGTSGGAVALSSKHPLALTNRGEATARDVLRFAARIKTAVGDHFAVPLTPEPVFLGFGDDADASYLRRTDF